MGRGTQYCYPLKIFKAESRNTTKRFNLALNNRLAILINDKAQSLSGGNLRSELCKNDQRQMTKNK